MKVHRLLILTGITWLFYLALATIFGLPYLSDLLPVSFSHLGSSPAAYQKITVREDGISAYIVTEVLAASALVAYGKLSRKKG